MENKKVDFLKNITKKPLVKKENTQNSWKKNVYGFECANYGCKC